LRNYQKYFIFFIERQYLLKSFGKQLLQHQDQNLKVVFLKDGGSPQKDSLDKSGYNRASGAAPAKNENELYVLMVNRSEPPSIVTIVSILS